MVYIVMLLSDQIQMNAMIHVGSLKYVSQTLDQMTPWFLIILCFNCSWTHDCSGVECRRYGCNVTEYTYLKFNYTFHPQTAIYWQWIHCMFRLHHALGSPVPRLTLSSSILSCSLRRSGAAQQSACLSYTRLSIVLASLLFSFFEFPHRALFSIHLFPFTLPHVAVQ